ncbi:hypothetical protein E8E11_004328 [Didymella keratinophila]|nr:hypothetical protein E8E11_004328 [Didymella keratinophila]
MYLRTVLLAAATLAASAALVHDQGEGIPDKEGLGVEFGPWSIPAPGALMHPDGEPYCPSPQVAKSSQEASVHMRLIHTPKEDLKATSNMSNIPNMRTPTWNSATSSALLLMLGSGWPLNYTRISRQHWLATNLTLSHVTPSSKAAKPVAVLTLQKSPVVLYTSYAPHIGDTAHNYTFTLFATPPDFVLAEQFRPLASGDERDDNATLDAESLVPFDPQHTLEDRELNDEDVLTRNCARVGHLAGTNLEKTFPIARQAIGTLEDGVLEQSGKAKQSAAQSPSSSGRSRISRDDKIGPWRWVAIFILNGLMFVLV